MPSRIATSSNRSADSPSPRRSPPCCARRACAASPIGRCRAASSRCTPVGDCDVFADLVQFRSFPHKRESSSCAGSPLSRGRAEYQRPFKLVPVIAALTHLTRLGRAGFVFAREGVLALVDPKPLPAPARVALAGARLIERPTGERAAVRLAAALTR